MTEPDPWRTAGFSSPTTGSGRWDRLFADLESELAAADEAEFAAEVADRTRRELAAVRLVDRLRSAIGVELTVSVDAGSSVVVMGVLTEVGPDWLMLAGRSFAMDEGTVPGGDDPIGSGVPTELGSTGMAGAADRSRRVLLPLTAVGTFRGLPIAAVAPGSEGHVEARYDMRMVLRRLVRDRANVALTLRTGEVVRGVLDRAGADFVDVASRELGESRHARSLHRLATVPVAALAMVALT